MKIPATKKGCVELINDMYKEIRELEEIVAGARLNEENLLHYLTSICAIIHYQCSLREQDRFVAYMIELGLYTPDDDDEDEDEVFGLA